MRAGGSDGFGRAGGAAGTCTKIVGGELLEADGVATGTQFVSKQPTATLANGTCTITVTPASLISVRLGK